MFKGIIIGMVLMLSLISVGAHAANGGLFGSILEKILGIPPGSIVTYSGDGTVQNAEKLGNKGPEAYQKAKPGQLCGGNQCLYGFDVNGNALCR